MSSAHGFLPYGRHIVDDDDIAAVVDVLKGDWLTTGPTVEAYEHAFAEAVGAPEAIACSSGTAGLHLAAAALDLGPGDTVVVPSVTFLATANAARYVGAEVAFCDIDPDTGLTDTGHVQAAIERVQEGGGSVKAIFPVHLTGHCVDMAVMTAAFPSLPMIEDACHVLGGAHGSGEGVRPVGAGDVSRAVMFSTHPVKTIATGEGGVLTTADSAFASRLRRLRNHGMTRDPATFVNTDMAYEDVGAGTGAGDSGTKPAPWYYEMQEVGWNYRLTDLQCALGIRQLEKLPHFVETRRRLRDHYAQRLDRLSVTSNGLVRAQPVAPGCQPAWHLAVALIDFEGLGTTRTDVMHQLREKGVGTQVHYIPVHLQPYYRDRYGPLSLPGAERYYSRCLSLPLFPAMTEADVDWVVEALADVLGFSSPSD